MIETHLEHRTCNARPGCFPFLEHLAAPQDSLPAFQARGPEWLAPRPSWARWPTPGRRQGPTGCGRLRTAPKRADVFRAFGCHQAVWIG